MDANTESDCWHARESIKIDQKDGVVFDARPASVMTWAKLDISRRQDLTGFGDLDHLRAFLR